MLSDRDALLQAILANPGDDTLRLVYADWLEEHGELLPQGREAAIGYARFLRTQLELMHCEIGDAGARALLESPITAGLMHLNLHGDSRKNKISDKMRGLLRDRFAGRVFV
jgi:uncharacterized protein (TIGR02996 family)